MYNEEYKRTYDVMLSRRLTLIVFLDYQPCQFVKNHHFCPHHQVSHARLVRYYPDEGDRHGPLYDGGF
jgi:hypothetical protein